MLIDELLLHYLMDKTGTEAFFEEPEKAYRPDEYFIVERLGSGDKNHIGSAQLAVQSYAPSLVEAMELDHRAIDALKGFAELPEVCRCKKVSDYNFTDISTHRYRWQAVFNITYYEE